MEGYIGTIMMMGFNWAPQDWQNCDGTSIPLNQYQALFSLLGVTYGGNGSTNFLVPDLRGRLPICAGQGPGLTARQMGHPLGAESLTLSTANMPAHTHAATFTGTGGGAGSPLTVGVTVNPISVGIPALPVTVNATQNAGAATVATLASGSALSASGGGSGSATIWTPGVTPTVPLAAGTASTAATTVSANATASATVTGGGGGITGGTVVNASTGSGAPVSNMPPFLAVNFCICLNGLYPSRP